MILVGRDLVTHQHVSAVQTFMSIQKKKAVPMLEKKFNLILNIGSYGTNVSQNCKKKTQQKILSDSEGLRYETNIPVHNEIKEGREYLI